MEALFENWQWGPMSIKNIVSVKTQSAGVKIKGRGNTQAYQLGVKFTGATILDYRGNKIDFSEGTAVYLPKEKTQDIDYITTITDQGNGVCIFFDSELPLPGEPQMLKNIGKDCENAFLKLLDIYIHADRHTYPEIMSAFYSLLALLLESGASKLSACDGAFRFKGAIEYMQRHICDEYLDIARAASLCNMGEKHFRDSFKEKLGISPLRYFHKMKINHIKGMLSNAELSVSEVAKMTGFDDANYFSRFFKKHMGVSPSKYREYYCSML